MIICYGHVARIMDTGVARTTKVVLPYWVPALCRVFVKAGKIVCALSFSEACLLSGVWCLKSTLSTIHYSLVVN